ncbi:MAG TPA: bifunctional UDP-N-acetylglucosamine diphosphorylase/glucosamine-1-phosphate N-acetyltransferase GlmU [Candidatus Limnocylindrales bacterium]|nr:bifunctional UDP-N-acetylglucosamine diphosphorylase/glucosamine-1-phosphate N-acetyltransferase GlmU [Candidatus Limnocylindrales bacterium]
MEQPWVVVLAAGEGKRMHSRRPKVLHSLCGQPMINYILDSASALTKQILIVVGHGASLVQDTIGQQWRYVLQAQQLGTGHAVAQALHDLPEDGRLLVLCGDTPLLEGRHITELLQHHGLNAVTVATTSLPDPTGYGRIVRGENGYVIRIVEDRDTSEEEKQIREVNTGTYCFDLSLLRRFLPMLSSDNIQGEYYLTDVIALMCRDGHSVGTYEIDDYRVGLGINDRVQLAEAAALIRERINRTMMLSGVTIIDPGSTYIDYGVNIGSDTVIWPNSIIEGGTNIGSSCQIGPGAHLRAAQIKDHVAIQQSVVVESEIENGVVIGPFAYIRPGSHLGENVKIGDFVEVKNSTLGRGTKVPHLSYVGDADIADGVNLGAGVIIVNYDGKHKHRSNIDSGAFIGCNSNLIAPLSIGANAYIGAGSTINKNVPPGALALARARQVNKLELANRILKRKANGQEKKKNEEKS